MRACSCSCQGPSMSVLSWGCSGEQWLSSTSSSTATRFCRTTVRTSSGLKIGGHDFRQPRLSPATLFAAAGGLPNTIGLISDCFPVGGALPQGGFGALDPLGSEMPCGLPKNNDLRIAIMPGGFVDLEAAVKLHPGADLTRSWPRKPSIHLLTASRTCRRTTRSLPMAPPWPAASSTRNEPVQHLSSEAEGEEESTHIGHRREKGA